MVDKLGLVLDRQLVREMAALLEHPVQVVVPGLRDAVEWSVASGDGCAMPLDIAAQIQNRGRTGLYVTPAPVGIELLQRHVRLFAQKVMMMNHGRPFPERQPTASRH